MKLLITGGAGFIGKWLVRTLPQSAEIVLVDSIDPQVHKTCTDFSKELTERATCIKADIRDQDAYIASMEGADVVVHLAAQTGTGQSMYEISRYVQHNVDGTAAVLEAIARLQKKPKRIVLTSSRAVYGEGAFTDGNTVVYGKTRHLDDLQSGRWGVYDHNGCELIPLPMQEDVIPHPISIYGLTKLWQEHLIENFAKSQAIDYAILRLQNVYGPEQELHNPYTGIIGIFSSLIMQKGEVELFEDGEMTRDFVYVEDVARALMAAIYHPESVSQIVNVGSAQPTSLKELINVIAETARKPVQIRYSGRFRVGDIRHAVADMSRYQATLGTWQPTSLKAGMAQYLNWYLEQNPLSEHSLLASFQEMEAKNLLLNSQSAA